MPKLIVRSLKPIFELMINNLLPFLASIFVFSFWIQVGNWWVDSSKNLDNSWYYALGKLRSLNMYLGKDAWFTFGPVSHWFGPPVGFEKYHPLPFYVLGSFISILYFVCLRKILRNISLGLPFKAILFSSFLVSLHYCQFSDRYQFYTLLIILLVLITGYLFEEKNSWWWVYCLSVLSVISVLYKFSLGILGISVFAVALIYKASLENSFKKSIYLLTAWLVLLFAAFYLTSGDINLVKFLALGLEMSGRYSEVMATPSSFFVYGLALLFAASAIFITTTAAYKLPRAGAVAFVVSISASIFLLFKSAHVRADIWHILIFYTCLGPFLTVMFMIAFSGYSEFPKSKRVLIVFSILILIGVFGFMMRQKQLVFPNQPSFVSDWLNIGNRFVWAFKGRNIDKSNKKINDLSPDYRLLFQTINSVCDSLSASGKKPFISFYPWELIFAEAIGRCTFKPFPQLQSYSVGPRSRIARLDAEFLSSENRPDLILLGSRTIDERNSVSEFTEILLELRKHYVVLSTIERYSEGYVLLRSTGSAPNNTDAVVCSGKPSGHSDFLQLKYEPTWIAYNLMKVTSFLFKAPVFTVNIRAKDQLNRDMQFAFRGYLSQLKEGVFISDESADKFILRTFRKASGSHGLEGPPERHFTEAQAVLSRDKGILSFSLVPVQTPMQVKFCEFKPGNA